MTARTKYLIALVLAALAAFGAIELIDEDGDGRPDKVQAPLPPSILVDGADADAKRDDRIPAPPQAVEDRVLQQVERGELSEPLKEPGDKPTPTEGPMAADEIPGCRTRFVVNQSSRRDAKVKAIVFHQTVSRENGWASQDSLTGLANRPSSGVSWHALVGRSEGRCSYNVPLSMKAWTAAGMNPETANIEVEAYGDEGLYVTAAGKARLLSVVRHISNRYGIPVRRGKVENCKVVVSGYIEHSDGGLCAGGHIDVTHRPADMAAQIVDWVRASSGPRIRRVDRIRCSQIRDWRRAGRPKGGEWERKSVWRRKALERRSLRCTDRGVVAA